MFGRSLGTRSVLSCLRRKERDGGGAVDSVMGEMDPGGARRLQRGSVGNDRGG
jgi:hypothetical protein